jgi:hypothetical protein
MTQTTGRRLYSIDGFEDQTTVREEVAAGGSPSRMYAAAPRLGKQRGLAKRSVRATVSYDLRHAVGHGGPSPTSRRPSACVDSRPVSGTLRRTSLQKRLGICRLCHAPEDRH